MPAYRKLRDLVYTLQGHVFGHAVGDEPDLHQLSDEQFEKLRREAVSSNFGQHSHELADLHTVLGEIVHEIFTDRRGRERPRDHVPDYDHFAFLSGRVREALDGRPLSDWPPEYVVRDRILLSDEPADIPARELSAIEAYLRRNPRRPLIDDFARTWDAAMARKDQIVETALRPCFRPATVPAMGL